MFLLCSPLTGIAYPAGEPSLATERKSIRKMLFCCHHPPSHNEIINCILGAVWKVLVHIVSQTKWEQILFCMNDYYFEQSIKSRLVHVRDMSSHPFSAQATLTFLLHLIVVYSTKSNNGKGLSEWELHKYQLWICECPCTSNLAHQLPHCRPGPFWNRKPIVSN